MLCGNQTAIQAYTELVNEFFTLWRDEDFINIPENRWMRFALRDDWQSHLTEKFKIYSLDNENKKMLDETFDELHKQKRLIWTTTSTSFFYSVFVTWKTINEIQKNRAMIDIRDLNKFLVSNTYSLFLQNDIISNFRKCSHIFVLNVISFFYQWKTHFENVYKQTVITNRDQKIFLMSVMKNKNFVSYVQRQMNDILRAYRHFVKTYIDDIVIKSKSLSEHLTHLRIVFKLFVTYNIAIKSIKVFLDYSNVFLLRQRINSLDLVTNKKKFKTVANIKFSSTFQNLKHYFDFIDYIRDHIHYYSIIAKSLQNLKTLLLKAFSSVDFKRKMYTRKIKIVSTKLKIKTFEALQNIISHSSILYHFNSHKELWIDLDTFKEFEIDVVVFHFKDDVTIDKKKWSSRTSILSVLFFSRQLITTERNYWSIELETFELIWTTKKIKHFIQSSNHRVIIQTDHQTIVNICSQTLITSINFILRMNIRLIKISQFLSQFNLNIRYKFDKNHIMFDALFRLVNVNTETCSNEHSKLNILFTYNATFVELFDQFYDKILKSYFENSVWKKIATMIKNNDKLENNVVELFFSMQTNISIEIDAYMKSRSNFSTNTIEIAKFNLIYHTDKLTKFRRLCISESCIEKVMKIAHDNNHSEFVRCFEIIAQTWYISNLTKTLKQYIKHCSKCFVLQTRRHKFWKNLQSIDSSCIFFHTLTLDFILTMSISIDLFNVVLSVTNKFIKRIILISEKDTFKVKKWVIVLFERLEMTDWDIFKNIITNRNRKFLFELWSTIFAKLKIHLLYSTSYHSQTNEASERINQTTEIILRFYIHDLNNSVVWSQCFSTFQALINNFTFVATEKAFNEVAYDFISNTIINLLKTDIVDLLNLLKSRIEIRDAVSWINMNYKKHYDRKHSSLFFKEDEWALLKLHQSYSISFFIEITKKLTQQFVDSFKILAKIERLTYRLNISDHWKVHSVFSVAQLKSTLSLDSDFFKRFRSDHSNSIFVEKDIDIAKSYELKRILNKRTIKREREQSIEYLIKWKDYDSKFDKWMNIKDFQNVKELIEEYESIIAVSKIN